MTGTDDTIKKVLMTTDTIGGVWTFCMELCSNLPDIAFHLVTTGAIMNAQQQLEVARLANVTVYDTDYKLEWMNDPWRDIAVSGKWLLRLEQEIQPDIVHLNCYAYGTLPFVAPKIVVAHSDVFSWWHAVKNDRAPNEWNKYLKRCRSGMQHAELVVAPSQFIMEQLQEIYDIKQPVSVIYNGRSPQLFYQAEKQQMAFCMGRLWDEAKNIQLLVDAAPNIACKVCIAGDHQFEDNEASLCGDNVEFLGRLSPEAIAEQLSSSSVYVLPAKYEPFGLSVLEAAYSGCALVLGDIPSLREIWQDAALFVDVNDSETLAAAINRLISDVDLLRAYQLKALSRARDFSSEAMASNYAHAYNKAIQLKKTCLTEAT